MSSWRELLWRWRRWLIVLLALVIVRAALPEVLRRVLVWQASRVLGASVEIGNVDLSLVRGGISLDDVAIWAASSTPGTTAATHAASRQTPPESAPTATVVNDPLEAPSQEAALSPPPAVSEPTANSDQPLIAWKKLAVELRWLPLFRKTVQLREMSLDSPQVALDRLANGQINLAALIPVSEEPAPASTPAKPQEGWSFGVDRFVLREGGVLFRDFQVEEAEPLEMNLQQIQIRGIALRPGFYGQPATAHVELAFDQASLRLDARFMLLEQGFGLEADLEAHGLPLRRSRFYIPNVGWSAFQGELDAALEYRLETGKQNQVSGTVSLRDVAIRVAELEEPALAWRDLTIRIDPVDLIAHRAVVAKLALDGGSLLVRPLGGDLLPFLEASAGSAASAATEPTSAAPLETKGPRATARAAPPDEPPWHWSLASLHIGNSRVRLLGTDEPIDVRIAATARDLADEGERLGEADLTILIGRGQAALKGVVQVSPPAFGGTLKVSDLPLPGLARATGAVRRQVLQSASLSSDLKIDAGLATRDADSAHAASDLQVSGKLALAGVKASGAAPQAFAVAAKSIGLDIYELKAPGVPSAFAGAEPIRDLRFKGRLSLGDLRLMRKDPKTFQLEIREATVPVRKVERFALVARESSEKTDEPIGVVLGDVRIENPRLRLTRRPEGFVLPSFSSAPERGVGSPGADSAPPRRVEVGVASLHIDGGSVDITDHTVTPSFEGRLSPLTLELSQARWPGPSVDDLKLSAIVGEGGKLEIAGAFSGGAGRFRVDADKLALTPFNPYAASFSSYSIAGGTLSMATKASLDNGEYEADNWLTLHGLDVRDSAKESLFNQRFGIPLSMALALLRDLNGNIEIGIPVSGDAEGRNIGIATVIRSALEHALVNALASPLKLVGAVFGGKGEGESLAPTPISFLPGRSEPTAEGAEQGGQVGELLASRPSIGVTLETAVTEGDVRWLREQALLKTWRNEGLIAKLGALTQKGTRDRVRDALEARGRDEPGELSPQDADALDGWLAEQPTIPAATLRALADARLRRVQTLLQAGSVDGSRVQLAEPAAEPAQGAPVVRVKLETVGR